MIVPANLTSALLIVVFVVPGFVFGSIRGALRAPRGPQDIDLSSRLVSAVVTSVLFDSVYVAAAAWLVPDDWISHGPQTFADRLGAQPFLLSVVVIALGIAAPALAAVALYYRVDWRRREDGPAVLRNVPRPVRRGGWRQFPTAWDRAAPGLGGTFVRVRLASGQWIGGWFSSESFIGTYPHSRDIYIQQQFEMQEDGAFGEPVPNSSGVWVSVTDTMVVEWLSPETEDVDG